MMKFPMIIYKTSDSDYCGLLPDFKGVFLAEKTLEELANSVQGAVEAWMEGEEPEKFPMPSSLEDIGALAEAKDRILMLADVDPSFLNRQTVRISVSVPRYALSMIDRAAKNAGMKRSTYLVKQALAGSGG